MTTELKIYGRHTSFNVQKVLWLADELALDYKHIEVGGRFGGNDTDEFLTLSPAGKVPVLCDGDRVVLESNTIIRYLADTRGADNWTMSDAYQSSKINRWLDWSIDLFEPAFVGVFWGFYRTPREERNMAAIEQSIADCEACMALLEHQLGAKPFLIGEQPTLADVATGVFMHRLSAMGLAISIPSKVALWHSRLCERPGFEKWVMSDFSELKGRSDY